MRGIYWELSVRTAGTRQDAQVRPHFQVKWISEKGKRTIVYVPKETQHFLSNLPVVRRIKPNSGEAVPARLLENVLSLSTVD